MILGGGNIQKTATTFTPKFVQLLFGCRIVPFDTSHTITLVRETFTDDNLSAEQVFDLSPLSPTTSVNILVNVPQVEVIAGNGGDGGATEEEIADAVWDEAYADHTTAGTFGKLMDIIRKSNLSIDGAVTANPTTTSFDTDLADPTGTHNHQMMLFVSGALEGYSGLITDFTNGADNTITVQDPFPVAPLAGDEFVILPEYVNSISGIQAGLATEVNQNLMLKYHDNITKFYDIDNMTEVLQVEAYFAATFDDDGVTRLKTIAFQDSAGTPVKLPAASRLVPV
jgi:hypothetical protein